MKLVALKKISSQLPQGAVFEMSEHKGKMLLALKLARRVLGDVPTPINATPLPPDTDAPSASPEPPKRGRYARRDLRAK